MAYALRGNETSGASSYNLLEFEVVGQSLPGRPFPGRVEVAQAVRIMTGAPVPEGADAVLPAEMATEVSGRLQISEPVPPGRHIGRRGEDVSAGTMVLGTGRVLRPQDVALLAAIGSTPVPVISRPQVALIVTGDELLPCGAQPEGYRIVDSNSVMLEALVRRDGGLPQILPLVADRQEAVREALLSTNADLILVSGGSSVGQEDHAPQVLAELGELNIHGVALRPAAQRDSVSWAAGRCSCFRAIPYPVCVPMIFWPVGPCAAWAVDPRRCLTEPAPCRWPARSLRWLAASNMCASRS